MRRSEDLTVDRPGRRFNGRILLIVLGGLFLFVVIFGRAIARFYVDYLWHDSLGRDDVFWGVITAKVTLFILFFALFTVMASINLWVADRSAPESFPANVHPYVERFHEVFGRRLRLVRYGIALLLALMLAIPAIAHWQDWLLLRNSKDFGVSDGQFGLDVGFYVFQLPFLTFLLDWLFVAAILVFLITVAAHVLNGGVVFVSPMPVMRSATRAHLAVLLAVLAVLKAGDYWLERYSLTSSQRGIVQGATYSVVKAQFPALMLLILIALLTAGLYLSVIRTQRWRLPLIASALWLVMSIVAGLIYPAIVQALVVNPNEEVREEPYIERNVDATRQALGLTNIDVRNVEFGTLTADDIEENLGPIQNTRLLNPAQMETRFLVDQGEVAGLTIADLDVDRYELDGKVQQVLVAARELDLGGVTNRSWQGLHLINTRGCGVVVAPTGQVRGNQRPDYQQIEMDRPELYFSPEMSGYAIANTESSERVCDESHQYEGTNGVAMNNVARRAAFALAFLDYNVLGSGAVNSDSQMLWVRGVNDRLEKLAPFLSYDADPYPVELDGHIVWIADAYTTTTKFPYGQRIGDVQRSPASGLGDNDNYVRNSVKAVVDAYTGEVTFYVVDDEDPIIKAWQSAFPDLFSPVAEMPEHLREHLRYPEDLFRIQTDVYSKYRIDAALFFQRDGNAWSVAQAPGTEPTQRGVADGTTSPSAPAAATTAAENTFATESDALRFVPYYTMFDTSLPDEEGEDEFVMLRPFVPFSTGDERTQLQSYMIASSDPDSYGKLITYIVDPTEGALPDGPIRVAGNAESQPEISQRISLDNQGEGGSEVRFGDMQLIPVADGLIYIRPYYVSVPQNTGDVDEVTEFRFVIMSYNDNSVLEPTISEALARLFPGFEGDVGDRLDDVDDVDDETDDVTGSTAGDTDTGSTDAETGSTDAETGSTDAETGDTTVAPSGDVEELLLQADQLFLEADAALAEGDLGTYQEKIDQARSLIAQVVVLLGG